MSSPVTIPSLSTFKFPPLSKVILPDPPLSKSKESEVTADGCSSSPNPVPLPPGGSVQNEPLQKCTRFHFTLPSEDRDSPRKKVKKLMTSVSAKRTEEVENHHSLRTLQLARASRDAFAARLRYHRLRVKELQMMCAMATDECEEAETLLKKAEWQIGEIKHNLDRDGIGLHEPGPLMFESSGKEPSGSDDDACHSDVSPSPSYSGDSKTS